MARKVPIACEAVPILKLRAIGLFTLPTSRILNPQTAPNRPTIITRATVREGIPSK